jgi:Leucine-rich repeat (LRR) protein
MIMSPAVCLCLFFLYICTSIIYGLDDDYIHSKIDPIIANLTQDGNLTIVSADQTAVLYSLYTSTNGEKWDWRKIGKIWNFTEEPVNPCDDWQGVFCDDIGNGYGTIIAVELSEMNLKGPLPNNWTGLSSLINMDLALNAINGTIPSSIGLLQNVTALDLSHNFFTGTIPPTYFHNLTCIEWIAFGGNKLHGRLPEFGNLEHLLFLNLYSNQFFGTIPQSIMNLKNLNRLYIGENLLTGSIQNITSLRKLQRLSLNKNSFTQAFPDNIGDLEHLTYLYIQDNHLTGTIPESLALNSTKLIYFTCYLNYLTGPLPKKGSSWKDLQNFIIDDNLLTGFLPNYAQYWKVLRQYIVYGNYFTSTLPTGLSQLSALEVILAQNNFLTGNPSSAFNTTAQTILNTVDLSANYFNGNLPDTVFGPSLISFTSFKTCFGGGIPQAICNAPGIQILDLDGMASQCSDSVWPGIPNSPQHTTVVSSGIPSCIWSFANLTQLRLSGNGLTGSIPWQSSYGNLTDLDLSYNSFSGTIPDTLQSWKKLLTFNLEYNKFCGDITQTGLLSYAYSENEIGVTLSLSMNRLSGIIPLELLHAENINIVNGNLFSCSEPHPPPYSDPNNTDYVCGSNLLDISLYGLIGLGCIITIFVCLFLKTVDYIFYTKYQPIANEQQNNNHNNNLSRSTGDSAVSGLCYIRQKKLTFSDIYDMLYNTRGLQSLLIQSHNLEVSIKLQRMDRNSSRSLWESVSLIFQDHDLSLKIFFIKILYWRSKVVEIIQYDMTTRKELQNLIQFLRSLRTMRRLTIFIMLLEVIITVPLYEGLKYYYRTYQTQYHWLISGAFLSGHPSAAAILVVWGVLLAISLFVIQWNIPKQLEDTFTLPSLISTTSYAEGVNNNSMNSRITSDETQKASQTDEANKKSNESRNHSSTNKTVTVRRYFESVTFLKFSRSKKPEDSQDMGPVQTSTQSFAALRDTKSGRETLSRKTMTRLTTVVKKVQEKRFWVNIIALVGNGCIVLVFKTACIYLLLVSNTSFVSKLLIEVALSSVDLIWGSIILPMIISSLPENRSTSRMLLKVFMLFFNSVIAPALIIAVADPSCFNGLFWPQDTLTEKFRFNSCLVYSTLDPSYCQLSNSWETSLDFTPSWIYNYTCYSTVLISYIPIFLLTYISLALFIPTLTIFLLSRKRRPWILKYFPGVYYIERTDRPTLKNNNNNENTATNNMNPLHGTPNETSNRSSGQQKQPADGNNDNSFGNSHSLNSSFLKHTDLLENNYSGGKNMDSERNSDQGSSSKGSSFSGQDPTKMVKFASSLPPSPKKAGFGSMMPSVESVDSVVITDQLLKDSKNHVISHQHYQKEEKNKRVILFPAFILASAVHHLLILLTFGLMCPSLAVVIALVSVTTTFTWEVLVGRWIMRDQKLLGTFDERFAGPYTLKLDELCEKVCCSPRKCFFLLCYGSAAFYGLCTLDMAGDELGWEKALFAPIVAFVVATVLYVVFKEDRTCLRPRGPSTSVDQQNLKNPLSVEGADDDVDDDEDGLESGNGAGRRSSVQLTNRSTTSKNT